MISVMRIDASTILLAGQVQAKRPQATAGGANTFQALDFAKPAEGSERKTQMSQPTASARLGSRLDIKV